MSSPHRRPPTHSRSALPPATFLLLHFMCSTYTMLISGATPSKVKAKKEKKGEVTQLGTDDEDDEEAEEGEDADEFGEGGREGGRPPNAPTIRRC